MDQQAKERQAQKSAQRLQRMLDAEALARHQPPPSIVWGYDPLLGYEVREGRSFIQGCKSITNATIGLGTRVARKGHLIDQMRRRPRPEQEKIVAAKPKNIKYLLRKTAAGITSLWVCGFRSRCKKVLDLPAGAVFGNAVIDNLGGDNYYVTLFYFLDGQFVFQWYSQTKLLKQTESRLRVYQGVIGELAAYHPLAEVNQQWTSILRPIGFGRFICNYGEKNPGTIRELRRTSGRIRFVVDLQSSNPIQEFILPPEEVILSSSEHIQQWLGLEVSASLLKTAPSHCYESVTIEALPVFALDYNTRVVYRTSQGDVAVGEILRQAVRFQLGRVTYEYEYEAGDGWYIYLSGSLRESLYRVSSWIDTSDLTTDRFLLALSQATGKDSRSTFLDIKETGLSFIDHQPPDLTAKPVPISATLHRIERSTKPKKVAVQLLDFKFKHKGQTTVNVFPPDINKNETNNFGTVIAASYG